ncbi:hypothetical protein GK0230 [Geobacillus kaustophilus HTA426]|uniref:Uncharacterized protein n=1 Tax=Geobacillus kaustophilus (strain HTA426) TaxID=235909 RepID=Q5L3G5_GEOKA|nr:hypothetical protein GK0230 [Geobacillus kaustophilus HTA426]
MSGGKMRKTAENIGDRNDSSTGLPSLLLHKNKKQLLRFNAESRLFANPHCHFAAFSCTELATITISSGVNRPRRA